MVYAITILGIALTSCSLYGRNPLYIGIIFISYLLVKALWVQLDISGEFRNGAVSVTMLLLKLFLICMSKKHLIEELFLRNDIVMYFPECLGTSVHRL